MSALLWSSTVRLGYNDKFGVSTVNHFAKQSFVQLIFNLKNVDETRFSDSYDVDLRPSPTSFSDSSDSNTLDSFGLKPINTYQIKQNDELKLESLIYDPKVEPRYARTVCDFYSVY